MAPMAPVAFIAPVAPIAPRAPLTIIIPGVVVSLVVKMNNGSQFSNGYNGLWLLLRPLELQWSMVNDDSYSPRKSYNYIGSRGSYGACDGNGV
jgi:hypothetical protein